MLSKFGIHLVAVLSFFVATQTIASASDHKSYHPYHSAKKHSRSNVQLGPRPFFLVQGMQQGKLKSKLQRCEKGPFYRTDFSIGHRGAAMMFPEHTRESYEAAAKMGAGILECDVTFTKDRELVCRHSQCDLHTTTNILEIPELAAKCSQNFTPYDPTTGTPASARCCTSDITVDEFKSLKGKMDAYDPKALTVAEYLGGTADWRTDLYTSRGTVMTHKESIELFKKLGAKMTPELKSPSVSMPFEGDYSQQDYAQQMIDEYKSAGVAPKFVFAQSFNLEDVQYWIEQEPAYGMQAVYLDGRYDDTSFDHRDPSTWNPSMEQLVADGVKIIAPPLWMLLDTQQGKIVPSTYAKAAKSVGLDIITWTFERSDLRQGAVSANGSATWYYQTVGEAISKDSDMYLALDVLAKEVGILGIFSDWPATVTYYANCNGL